MKRFSKQVLALVLSVCLLLGVFPALPASAGEETESGITRAQLAVSVYNWFLPTASGNTVSFSDIENCTEEQKAAILTLAKAGIVEGTAENTFSPGGTVTRAQAAVVLYRAMRGAPGSTGADSIFNDIEKLNEEFQNAINYLTAQNVLQASDATEGKFVPDGAITQETLDTWLSRVSEEGHFTRAQLAVMVCEAFDLTATGEASFDDIGSLDPSVQADILTLANLGIVSGTADSDGKSFDPQGLVSRMAAAVTIYRVYEKTTEVGSDIPEQTLFTDVSLNVMPAVFNLLVFKGVLSEEDIVYSTGEDRGLFLLNAMANRTTVQGWLNKAAAELNPAQGHTVTVNVTGEGADVASYTVNWYQNGEKLQAEGTNITVTDTSVPLYYEVVLDNDALKQYSMTNGSGAVIFSEGNTTEITVTLTSYQTVSVNGTVQDENEAPIPGATVTITQHYSASVSEPLTSVTTNASGEFTYSNVKTVPSVLKISAQGYYDYSTAVSFSGESSTAIDLGTVQLSPLPDSKVTLSLSFQAAAGSGQKTTTTSLSSFANLKFTVHKGDSEVTDFAAQYPYLVFDKDSGVSGGDTLTISVTDASGKAAMLGGAVEVKLNSDGSGLAELTLVENGKIAINALTGVDQATVMVFNNGGDLVVSGAAWGAYTSPSLPSGRYTVVALEKTDLIQSVSSLSQLSELGLASNNYVQTTATVSNGVITEIDSLTVPELDESAISFTDFASTTVDYVTAAVGRNVTLRVEYQLKEQYENSPVSLTITLPDGLSFKGAPTLNSAVVSSYGNGNTYTISGTGSGVVRVFLTGATAGSYDISPKLSIAGATKPVGTAHLEITDAQIYVPSTTGKLKPTVSGISAAEGTVTIYVDGEAQQGTVTADKTGAWKTTLSLSDTTYSQHEVYAQIHKDDDTYTTETKTLIYDPDYIDVSKVTMYNVVDDREQEVVFDYNNPYSGSNYFTANDSEFTFVIEFKSGEDCSRLANVRLNLFTANGDVYTESAERMEGTNKYTVVTSGVIPVNVGVEYLCLPAEDPTSPEGFLEYDWTEGQIPQGISSVMEIQRVSEWEDAVALWIGLKQEDSEVDEADDSLFPVLIHRLDYSDYANCSEDEMKSEGFAKVEKTGIFEDNGQEESVTGYHRVVLSNEAVQHVVVLFPDDSEGPEGDGVAVAITIPIDFREIIEGLEEEEEALAALAAEVGIEGAGITFATQELSLLSGDTQNLAQVIPFPYQDDTLSEAALNWRKLSSMAQDRNNTENLAYFPAIADLMFLEGQVAGERIQIWEEIEYERERIRQLAKAESCYGLPLMTQEEVNELWNQLTKIVELEQGVYEYREAALDLYTKRILAAGMADFATGLERRMEEKVEEVETAFYDGLYELLEDAASWVVAKVVGSAKTAKKLVNLCVKGIEFYDKVTERSENFIDALEKAEELVNQFVEEGKIYGELDGRPYWEETRKNYADLGKLVKRLDDDINEKVKENRKNCPPEPLPNHQDDPAKSPCPDKIYGIDPSGYVYEAVPSNRLEGVTAKILKKNSCSYTEWGDAQQYGGQSSTITTTETGEYRWDVPEGTWKVEFTKVGYINAEKDSLVVPPPQTDINIGMVSAAAPKVSAVQAYTDGVLVEFSQYMEIESVVEGSITLVMGGEAVSCTVEPVNAEADTNKDTQPIYASRFFVKPNSGATLSGEVTVTVSHSAKNYNGTTIETKYSNQHQVKGECPTGIEAPGSLSVLVGDSSSLSFTLQPGLADQELKVEITTPSLVGFADNQASSTPYSATTGANGSANVTLKGLLPGAGLVKITHAESGLSTTVKIKIVSTQEQLNAPGTVVAKLANGTTVTDGMTVSKGAQVVLSGSPAGVTIQYTLDGTCPKTTGAKTYTGPIIINQDTTLRAVAKGSDGVFGEVSTWKMKVSGSGSVSGGGTSDKEPESLLPFGDVSEKAWYYSAIEYVYEHDLMAGTSATTFEPNATLSRAMVAQILYNLEGQPTVEGESAFTDTNTHWAATAITWAQKTGVVSGYENNTFRPNKAVTREELAQMLYNYAKYKEYNLTAKGDLTVFPDGSKVSSWAETAMAWANGNRLINGFEDNTLRPGGDSTRAQAASILMNFDLNLVEE